MSDFGVCPKQRDQAYWWFQ